MDTSGRNAVFSQESLDGVGTTLRQFLVVSSGTDAVGVAVDHDNVKCQAGHTACEFCQFGDAFGFQNGFVESEECVGRKSNSFSTGFAFDNVCVALAVLAKSALGFCQSRSPIAGANAQAEISHQCLAGCLNIRIGRGISCANSTGSSQRYRSDKHSEFCLCIHHFPLLMQ